MTGDVLDGVLDEAGKLLDDVVALRRRIHEQPELGLGMRRAHVLDDPLPTIGVLRDLHRRRTRGRTYPPNERHTTEPRTPLSA